MVSFADRFKSLKDQALQTIETIKEDEQVKGALGKAREKYDAVAKKIDEVADAESVKGFIEKGEATVGKVYHNVEDRIETSKQNYQEVVEKQKLAAVRSKLDAAEKLAKQKQYPEAIALLETAYSPESELYGEAQKNVATYRHLALLNKAEKLSQHAKYTEAITSLEEAYQPGAEFYDEAQSKIASFRQEQFSALSQQAEAAAQDDRYVEAIELLEKAYQPGAEFYDEAQSKIASFRQEQFSALSQQAEAAAQDERYVEAIELLEKAYQPGTEFYDEAQSKIASFRQTAFQIIIEGVNECVENYSFAEAMSLLNDVIKPNADNVHLTVLFPPGSDGYSQAQDKLLQCQKLFVERQQLIESYKHFSAVECDGRLIPAITLDNITYRVQGMGRLTNSPGELEILNTQGVYIFIGLNVLNIDKKTREVSVASMILVDAQEREYSLLANAEKFLPLFDENLFGTDKFQVQPDVATFGVLVFEVPKSATDLKLKMADGFMGRGIFLPLDLVFIKDEENPPSDSEQ